MPETQTGISIDKIDKEFIGQGIQTLEDALQSIHKDILEANPDDNSLQLCQSILEQLSLAKLWSGKLNGSQMRPLLFSVMKTISEMLNDVLNKKIVLSQFVESDNGKINALFLQNAAKEIGPNYSFGMSQTALFISVPSGLSHLWTVDSLIEWIQQFGIKTEIKKSQLSNIFKQQWFDRLIPVTLSQDPELGKPCELEDNTGVLRQKHGFIKVNTKQSEEGIQPYFSYVNQGQTVLQKKACETGKEGYDIFQQNVPPIPPLDVSLPSVENGNMDDDELSYTAKQAGCILEIGKRIVIEPVRVTNPDEISSNISESNSIYIGENCPGDGKIETKQHVFVNGSIEGTSINAGGSIYCNKGIEGIQKAKIEAKERVRCLYIHQAEVTVGEDIVCEKEVMQSEIWAKCVQLTGKGSTLFGGAIHVWNEVKADVIGSEANISTKIILGEELEELQQAQKKLRYAIAEKKDKQKNVLKSYNNLKTKQQKFGSLLPEQVREMERYEIQVKEAEKDIAPIQQEFQKIQRDIDQSQQDGRRVVVNKKVYPKTEIMMLDQVYYVTEEMGPTLFQLENGEITVQSIT